MTTPKGCGFLISNETGRIKVKVITVEDIHAILMEDVHIDHNIGSPRMGTVAVRL